MKRLITTNILSFCIVVIIISMIATMQMSQQYKRQAMASVDRFLSLLQEHGATDQELIAHAEKEGYRLVVAPAGQIVTGKSTPTFELVSLEQRPSFLLGSSALVLLILSILTVGFGIALSIQLSSRIIHPLKQLTDASLEITAGTYDLRVQVTSQDEMGSLITAFNAMAARLQETMTQLNQSSAEMESIILAMRHGLIAVDEKMHIIRLNPTARAMFEVHGNPYNQYVLDVTRNAKLEGHLADAMEQKDMYTVDLPVRMDKQNRLLRLYITGLVREDQSIGALALIEDITELRRLENVRVDFVSNVTHELKTPLTSIRGFVETLQQGAIEDRDTTMRFLSIISMETERLSRLIDDILSLSSLESGKRRDVLESVQFSPYVRQICELLQSSAREKNTVLKLEDRSDGVCVLASGDKLKQMLINIIDNAIKYTPENGHVTVSIVSNESHVMLMVEDDGIGIEQEHIPRLFERFYRVDKGRTRSMGGTGLGLAIVKHIVLEMNGQIEVESEPNKGTIFTVKLPIVPCATNEKI